MASKKTLEDEARKMRDQLSEDDNGGAADGDDAPLGEETRAQWESFKEAQGVAAEELKGVWEQLGAELRDMPAKKPLTTALVAFMLGLSIGRMGRK